MVRYVQIATTETVGKVFATIEWDGMRLAITGVEGPKRNGDARGSSGQIERTPEWIACPEIDLDRFMAIWKRWHLNDMRDGCEHQRELGWTIANLSQPCPTCDYKGGTAWLFEPVPANVIEYLTALPETDELPDKWK